MRRVDAGGEGGGESLTEMCVERKGGEVEKEEEEEEEEALKVR